MSLSLREIYDVLITEIGILTIPRNGEYEVRSLTKKSSESLRDNSGTNVGSHRKANALFKSDIYFEVAPAIKDLVDNGIIKPNGNAQGAALAMLSFLTVGKLKDEIEYIEKVIHMSIVYRVALNENIHGIDRNRGTIREDELSAIESDIHNKYENQYIILKNPIIEKIRIKMENMLSEYVSEFSLQPSRLSLSELCVVCISVCVSSFEVDIRRNRDEITEKQTEIKNYLKELNELKAGGLLPLVVKEYYLSLWNECSMLKIRDRDDERTQIEKYIYPHFTYNKEKKESPVVFARNNKRIIIAESGLGKSSYLDMLTSVSIYRDVCAYIEIDKNNREKIEELEKSIQLKNLIVPVLIRGGDYQYQEEMLFGGMLDCVIGGPTAEKFNEWITEISQLKERRVIVMVDAIDEIDYLQRDSFLSGLNELVEKLGRVDLLVTCRPIDRSFFERNRLFRGIEEWRLEPFDREQMKKFVEAKIKADTRGVNKDANILLDNIVKNDYLKILSSNPYMLEKMLVHDYSTGNNSAYSTIHFLVDNLIDRRWDKLFNEFRIESRDFTIILAGIAYEMVYRQKTIIGKVNLVGEFLRMAIAADLADKFPEEMFREIVSRMNNAAGLLIYENEGYKFQYQIFASYLSAEWIYYQVVKNKSRDANVLEDLLPSSVNSGLWADVITILFTIIYENEPRNEFLSTNLFRKILCAGMGTNETESKSRVQNIFDSLKQRAFGENNIISDTEMRTCIEEFGRISKGGQ